MAIGEDFTSRLLKASGFGASARVLDVGCGSGDVSLLAAKLVGNFGAVVGLDHNAGALEITRKRSQEANLRNVIFAEGDLGCLPTDLGMFDVIVGRRVLMYQADAVSTLQALIPSLRTGGLIVLHEHDTTIGSVCSTSMPLHATVQGWIKETLEREGADLNMGLNLYHVIAQAGLSVEHVRAEAVVQTPTQKYPVASIIEAMLPRIVAHGVASEQDIDIKTLSQRLDAEREHTSATYIGDMMFGAWARKAS